MFIKGYKEKRLFQIQKSLSFYAEAFLFICQNLSYFFFLEVEVLELLLLVVVFVEMVLLLALADVLLHAIVLLDVFLLEALFPDNCCKAKDQFCKSLPFWQPEFNQL